MVLSKWFVNLQYLFGTPFALNTAAMRCGIEAISLWHCLGVMEAQISLMLAVSSLFLGQVPLIFLLIIPHRFSVGFTVGLASWLASQALWSPLKQWFSTWSTCTTGSQENSPLPLAQVPYHSRYLSPPLVVLRGVSPLYFNIMVVLGETDNLRGGTWCKKVENHCSSPLEWVCKYSGPQHHQCGPTGVSV